ncbi:MAG: sigma-70 family RNA polymerase sigma factor, partial [Gammaproteobacteria bacterium]
MTTNVTIEYLTPLSFELLEWESPHEVVDTAIESPAPDVRTESQNDLGYFMTMAGRFELLTAEDERAIGHALWACRRRLLRLMRRARRGGHFPALETAHATRPVTAFTRRRLARVEARARQLLSAAGHGHNPELVGRLADTLDEMDALRTELVERNLRLVVWVAKRFRNRGFDFIDLIQEGNLGLMRAIDRFDPAVGARFSTFATHWIQQGIRRALAEKARTIRIPVNRIPEARQALSARGRLAEILKRAPRAE